MVLVDTCWDCGNSLLQGELLGLEPLVAVVGRNGLLRGLPRRLESGRGDYKSTGRSQTYGNKVLVGLISGDLVQLLVEPWANVRGVSERGLSDRLTARAGQSWPSDP